MDSLRPTGHEKLFVIAVILIGFVASLWLPSFKIASGGRQFGPFPAGGSGGPASNSIHFFRSGQFLGPGPKAKMRNLVLATHGRLMWFDPISKHAEIIHEGRGVYYGMFPSAENTMWVVSRPHNWHPRTSSEALLLVDYSNRKIIREVVIPSRFTHDAIRHKNRVFIADTGSGRVFELELPTMNRVLYSVNFTKKEHPNTLAYANDPSHPHAVWVVLHNLGASKVALVDLESGKRLREYEGNGEKVHGFVQWGDGFIILNSGAGQVCKFTPPSEMPAGQVGSDSNKGVLDILWVWTKCKKIEYAVHEINSAYLFLSALLFRRTPVSRS